MAKLEVDDAIVRPFTVVFRHFGVYLRTLAAILALASVVTAGSGLLGAQSAFAAFDAIPEEPTDAFDPMDVLSAALPLMALGGAVTLLATLATVVAGAMGLVVASAVLDGGTPTFGDAWRAFAPRLGHVVLVTFVVFGAVMGIFLVGAIGAILILPFFAALAVIVWLAVSWVFAPAAVVLDKENVMASLARSRALVRGAWWQVFVVLVVLAIIFAVARALVTLPITLLAAPAMVLTPPVWVLLVQEVLRFGVSLVSVPVGSTAIVLMYRRLAEPEETAPAGEPAVPAG